MAEKSFSFEDLFGQNYRQPHQVPDFTFTSKNVNQYTKIGSPKTAKDIFGRLYYLPITIGGVVLPYPLMRISRKKRIVETDLVHRTGTVKELISKSDWEIEIHGYIVSKDGDFPDDQYMALRDLEAMDEALEIQSALTDIFFSLPDTQKPDDNNQPTNQVVIYDFDMPDMRGVSNVQPYAFKCKSDAKFSIIKTITG